MHFSTKKMGVNFFLGKKTKPGGGRGGSEGGLVKDHTFPEIFFWNPSLSHPYPYHMIFVIGIWISVPMVFLVNLKKIEIK